MEVAPKPTGTIERPGTLYLRPTALIGTVILFLIAEGIVRPFWPSQSLPITLLSTAKDPSPFPVFESSTIGDLGLAIHIIRHIFLQLIDVLVWVLSVAILRNIHFQIIDFLVWVSPGAKTLPTATYASRVYRVWGFWLTYHLVGFISYNSFFITAGDFIYGIVSACRHRRHNQPRATQLVLTNHSSAFIQITNTSKGSKSPNRFSRTLKTPFLMASHPTSLTRQFSSIFKRRPPSRSHLPSSTAITEPTTIDHNYCYHNQVSYRVLPQLPVLLQSSNLLPLIINTVITIKYLTQFYRDH